MRWNAEQLSRFLAVATRSVHGPIWLVMVLTGLQCRELLGLQWQDIDEARGMLHVHRTVRVLDGTPKLASPLAGTSVRDALLATEIITALTEHRRRQGNQRRAAGAAWQEHDLVFCRDDGTPLVPSDLQRDFDHWIAAAGVPPIRMHDLRHVYVTLAHAAAEHLPGRTAGGSPDSSEPQMEGPTSPSSDNAGEEPEP